MILEGYLDFEGTLQFKQTCTDLLKTRSTDRMVLNMEKLKFVGSSGIGQFIQILKDFNKKNKIKTKLCKLSIEFERMFRSYETARNPFQVFTDEQEAIISFDLPPTKKSHRKPIDN